MLKKEYFVFQKRNRIEMSGVDCLENNSYV